MIEAAYKKKGIRIDQVWFAGKEEKEQEKADIVFFHGRSEASTGRNSLSAPFHTLITDLTLSHGELLSKINKNVRYEIRRNVKEPVECRNFFPEELLKSPQVVEQFATLYELMYKEKGINKKFNMLQLKAYLKKDAFVLTGIYEGEKPLVFHSYIVGDEQTRLLHSVSDFRSVSTDANLIARANKRLHWEDLVMFKGRGIKRYDWGGVSDPEKMNGIDAFKIKFGGNPITYYNVYTGKSFLGKVVVTLLKIKNGIKR